jgi:pimeloyl-ACP methyl ester carboxylesterase
MRHFFLSIILSLVPLVSMVAQHSVVGRWEGSIVLVGGRLGIAVEFSAVADSLNATIDIPQQGAAGLRLSNVSYRSPRLHFELPAGPGLAIFDGTVAGDSAYGDFRQAGFTGVFSLRRGAVRPDGKTEPPPPYSVDSVTFHNGTITLAGTLTVPRATGKHPALILITGSGAQNRDEEVAGFRVFRILADHLTRQGIAVLRCDDRGVGGSTGDIAESTMEDFAGDVTAALRFLKSRAEINPEQIGLLGHSEGAEVAGVVASERADIALIISMAGPAVSGDKIILSQMESLNRARGVPEDRIARDMDLERRVFEVVRSDTGWEKVVGDLRKTIRADMGREAANLPEDRQKLLPSIDSLADVRARQQIAAAKSRWFRHFIDFDPAAALSKVRCPVLALFGEKDMQVLPSVNREPMEVALRRAGNKDYSITVVAGANHLFQEAETGTPMEYATLKKEFLPGFLETISGWVGNRVAIVR